MRLRFLDEPPSPPAKGGTSLTVERAELIEEDEDGATVRFRWIVGSIPA